MKIYATQSDIDFEQFAGKDLWVKCSFEDSIWGMIFYDYVDVISIDSKLTFFRSIDSDFISGEELWSPEFTEPEMINYPTDRFLEKYKIAQPIKLFTTEDMEEILEMKLTRVKDWYSK